MHVEVKTFHSPDIEELALFSPQDPADFGFLLELTIGPRNVDGGDIFQVMVCTPNWLLAHKSNSKGFLRGYLIVHETSVEKTLAYLREYVAQCNGNSWQEIALKLSRVLLWEFEDYKS